MFDKNEKDMELKTTLIENKIHSIRNVQVMLDRDLAELYQVKTRVLMQAVKRNLNRFPDSFLFQLSETEFKIWKSQIVMSNADKIGLRRPPYAFTEQGVAMLSGVLKSEVAVNVSIQIMQAFVAMRKFLMNNASVFQRLDQMEMKQIKTDEKLEQIFKALEAGKPEPDKGIFFDGQVFDAYELISRIIRTAIHEIILIDSYIDENTLTHLSKKGERVKVLILTKTINKQMALDIKKANEQYGNFEIGVLNRSHDRFLVIDRNEIYHIGASIKDLGKRWFAFSKLDVDILNLIMEQLKKENVL